MKLTSQNNITLMLRICEVLFQSPRAFMVHFPVQFYYRKDCTLDLLF